jgi:hypothetical protein
MGHGQDTQPPIGMMVAAPPNHIHTYDQQLRQAAAPRLLLQCNPATASACTHSVGPFHCSTALQ